MSEICSHDYLCADNPIACSYSGHMRVLDTQVRNASKHSCLDIHICGFGNQLDKEDSTFRLRTINQRYFFFARFWLSKPRNLIRSCFIYFPKLQPKRSMQNAKNKNKSFIALTDKYAHVLTNKENQKLNMC